MRPTLINQPQIEALSMALKQSLATLVAAIQTGWNVQHRGDGTHTDVTATSAAITGRTSTGRLVLGSATYTEPFASGAVINNLTTPGIENAAHLRITHYSNPLYVYGIDARGRERGDLLLVSNCDNTISTPADLYLWFEQAGSLAANRFAETLASPGGAGSFYVINGARSVWLVYDEQTTGLGGSPLPRWRVVDGVS